jgi:GT2 family glycosyltransferase/tetratricopeptide (TPR) repeat protein
MMKISACMIAKNESENIGKSLASLEGIADEIIVVDTGSADDTKKIAENFGASVYDYKWQDDFAAAKNYAIKKASGDWIIFFDADEYFAEESRRFVRPTLAAADGAGAEMIAAKLVNIDADRDNLVINSFRQARIFKNSGEIFYVGKIHENLAKKTGKACLINSPQEIVIYHTGYSTGRVRRKLERNLRLLEMVKAEDRTPIYYRYLCDCYYGLKEWEKAYAAGKKYIAENGKVSDMDSMTYVSILQSLRMFCDSSEKITAEFDAAVKLFADKPDIYAQYGDFCCDDLHDYNKALDLYEKAVEIYGEKHGFKEADNYEGYADRSYVRIGSICRMKRLYDKALENYIEALKLNKYNSAALKNAFALLKNVDAAAKIALLKQLYDMESTADMTFLEDHIKDLSLGKSYSYLQKYFSKQNPSNDSLRTIQSLFTVKNWQKLKEICGRRLADNQTALFFGALGGKTGADFLTSDYREIFDAIRNRRIRLPEQLNVQYLNVLAEAVLNYDEKITELLALIRENSADFKLAAADLLMKHNLFGEALAVYNYIDEKQLSAEKTGDKGICLYKNEKYHAAAACFDRALEKGALRREMCEYHAWAKEKRQERKKLTSIVILSYNQLKYTKLCVDSIRQFTAKGSYEIIVVDNHSTDGAAEWLQAQADIKLILNEENKGFPTGCNQGIAKALGEEILLLNNDTIVTPNWLENMKAALYSNQYVGAVGCITNSCSNFQRIDTDYKDIDGLLKFAAPINISDSSKWEKRAKLIGFCLLLKRTCVDELGGLDEIFSPGNFEDDDYSYRLGTAGYALLLCRDAFIHHFGSASFQKDSERQKKYAQLLKTNEQKFTAKWRYTPQQMLVKFSADCYPWQENLIKWHIDIFLENPSAENGKIINDDLAVAPLNGDKLLNLLLASLGQKLDMAKLNRVIAILQPKFALAVSLAAYKKGLADTSFIKNTVRLLENFGKQAAALKIICDYDSVDEELQKTALRLAGELEGGGAVAR